MIKFLDIDYLDDIYLLVNNYLNFIDYKYIKNELTNLDNEIIGFFVGTELVGVLSYLKILDEIEINYIVVKEEFRRNKIASELFKNIFKLKDFKVINLEVDVTNCSAIEFYLKLGFKQIRIRKNYYQGKDGLEMKKVIGEL